MTTQSHLHQHYARHTYECTRAGTIGKISSARRDVNVLISQDYMECLHDPLQQLVLRYVYIMRLGERDKDGKCYTSDSLTSNAWPSSAWNNIPAPRWPLRKAIHRTSALPPFSLGLIYGTCCSSTVPEKYPVAAPCCHRQKGQVMSRRFSWSQPNQGKSRGGNSHRKSQEMGILVPSRQFSATAK